MKLLRFPVGMWLLALAATASAQPEPGQFDITAAPPGEAVDSTTQATGIRYKEDPYLRMTVPVRLSGSGPYRFLVDTGSDRTAVSHDLARRLRLAGAAPAKLHSVTGVSEVGTATVPQLDLSAKKVTNIEAALLDGNNIGADGILGLDTLRSQRILFDFKAKTLTVVPSAERVFDEDGTIVVTGKRRKGRLILTHARAEGARVSIVVDTGSEVSIGNEALRRKLSRSRLLRRSGVIELQSVTGEMLRGEYMFVKRLEIGGIVMKELAVVFADSHAFAQLGLDRKPALFLGMNALRSFERVSIDFDRMKMRVVLQESSALDSAVFARR